MSLALAYTQTPQRKAVDVLIMAHFDAHGVASAAARYMVHSEAGRRVEVYSKFPETGPVAFPDAVENVLKNYEPRIVEVIDIPVNVRAPAQFIEALRRITSIAKVVVFDHHETDKPFIPSLIEAGIFTATADTATAMLSMLLAGSNNQEAFKIGVVGVVADRDASIISIVSREKIERYYLPLANKLDVIVRSPRIVGLETQGDVAKWLASSGVAVLERVNVEYPPETIARELSNRIVEAGDVAILVDMSEIDQRLSQWIPKTLEQMLLNTRRHIAIAVAPGINPRTKSIEGYDVRMLRYWLSDVKIILENIAREEIQRAAAQGNVVGHGDYISIRMPTKEEAMNLARAIYQRVEGLRPAAAHLVNDQLVAEAVRRDYQKLYQLLERIAAALEKGAEEKAKQVRLLEQLYERDERTRYD